MDVAEDEVGNVSLAQICNNESEDQSQLLCRGSGLDGGGRTEPTMQKDRRTVY